MENGDYQSLAVLVRSIVLSGDTKKVYEYAKRHREHTPKTFSKLSATCNWYCEVVEEFLEAVDVMATIDNRYIWNAFYAEVGKTERELKRIKDDYIGEVDWNE